jgi:CRISPR system Cascade subunit CasC
MEKRFYLDIHVLQTVPPSCVNRDDTGSPKTAVYGGVTRARVSSQAWKRAMRVKFGQIFTQEQIGKRTKEIPSLLAQEIRKLDPAADAEKVALKALKDAGIGVDEAKNKNDALFFISKVQLEELAKLAATGETDKKLYKAALNNTPSVDMVLFGRMVASDPMLNLDATAQVAHSISTHAIHNEYDYFTAMDDCAPEDNAGAGHLGTVEFNSATLYRYATVNVTETAALLGESTPEVLQGFVNAFALSMPTGKQNSFANGTVPDLIYVTLRRDQPVNLAPAFEKPVAAGKQGYIAGSVKQLTEYAADTYRLIVEQPTEAFWVSHYPAPDGFVQQVSLPQLLEKVKEAVGSEVM